MRAIQITEFGGPEVLTLTELPDPEPGEGQFLLEVDTAGVNYADTHQAENSYLAPQQLPLVPGAEVVGRDPDGRRVVALLSGGGYAERALAHPSVTFELPDAVDDRTALALILQGTTAWHLLRTSAHLRSGESVVVHSGAGGVGSLAIQLARAWGAGRVIATASSPDKHDLRLASSAPTRRSTSAGLDAQAVTAALVEANEGRPVDIVLEMTGGAVFDGSLAALAPFGRLVTYGLAGRKRPAPIQATDLMASSRAVIGFWLVHALHRPGGLGPAMEELLSLAASGGLRALDGGRYPLDQARQAHEAIRSRRTTGKLVLDVRA